ncbi:hypothetical protein Ancab_007944 [Ancistrocladus abbreviatus]
MKKSCELCKSPARMYCESDQAILCWDCDSKVHGANFLVARHSRSLLCHVCQSPTPWSASGAKLGPTVSVCDKCVADIDGVNGGNVEEIDTEEDEHQVDYDDDNDDDEDEVEEDVDQSDSGEEEGENQVVPWSSSTPPPPAATSSSSSSEEESSTGICCRVTDSSTMTLPLKRVREDHSDLRSQGDPGRWMSRQDSSMSVAASDGDDESPAEYLRPLKGRRIEPDSTRPVRNRTGSTLESIRRLQREISSGQNTSAAILGLCRLCKDPDSVDPR